MCILKIETSIQGETCFVNANPKDWLNDEIGDLSCNLLGSGFTNYRVGSWNLYENCIVFDRN